VADDPRDAAQLDRMNRRVQELFERFSTRSPNDGLGRWIDRASRWFPRPVGWLLAGAILVLIRRPRGLGIPLVLAGAASLVLLGTALVVPAAAEYSIPVVPAFVLLAVTGLLAARRSQEARTASP
jgi:hypothetical protein